MAVLEFEAEKQLSNKNNNFEPLIPGLPDEIAELCLLHLPYPYHALVRSVSSSWNRVITHPSFLLTKKTLSPSLSRPHLFVLAFHQPTSNFQWQALDPSSGRWFVLPAMPPPPSAADTAASPAPFACASLAKHGKLFVMDSTRSTLVYCAATNQWSQAAPPMSAARSFFAAEGVNGKIVTIGGGGGRCFAEIYDPENDTWKFGAALGAELAKYEVASVGESVYVTEGWRWPFVHRPRGWVYEGARDTWREMREALREGWSGVTVAVNGRLFVIAEYGDSPVKVYDEGSDTWQVVGGDRFPREAMQRPFVGRGLDGRMYVVCCGLNVAIGSVVEDCGVVKVMWEVVEAPEGFRDLSPFNCQVLYA